MYKCVLVNLMFCDEVSILLRGDLEIFKKFFFWNVEYGSFLILGYV